MQSIARSFVGIVLLAGAASPFVFSHRGASHALPSGTAIVEMHGEAITEFLPGQPVPVQDIRPQVLQRGVQLDGMLRAGPSERMVIHANPFENAWRAPRIGGVNLAMGTYEVAETDIALPSEGFSWVIGRTYNARQQASGGSHRDSDGVQGADWAQSSQPSITFYDNANDVKDMVYVLYGADRFAEYKRVDASGATFKGVNGAAGVFLYAAGSGSEPDTYELTDQHGNELTFIGFDADAGAAAGQLWTIVDPDGNKAY